MKKASCILIAIMILTILLPTSALAEEGTPTTAPEAEATPTPAPEEETVAVELEIDNEHIYDGMDKAYKDGYIPTVKDGVATIVVPLLASGEIKDNTITVTPGLGDTSSSPFVYSNYQKDILLTDNAVTGGITVSSYLVRFDIPLVKNRYIGVYPVSIDITAMSANGAQIQKSFTVYVTITDGKDPNAAEPTPKPQTPKSAPKIIVSRYSIDPSPVTAGEEFTAKITLENTSEKQSVKNMSVTVSCDSSNLVLLNDSNVIYIDSLEKSDTTLITLKYKTDLETPPQRYTITLNMEYDNSDATTFNSSGTALVEVVQPLRVEMETPQIPETVNAGDTVPLSFQVMNMGRSGIYNVRIELDAPGLIPSETVFIGNMEPGTAMPGDMDVFIGTKNMSEGYEGDDKYGNTNGVITLIYEDSDGNEYTLETEFMTNIEPPVIAQTTAEPEEEEDTAGQWWISIVIGGVVVAGLAAYIIIRRKRGNQKNADF